LIQDPGRLDLVADRIGNDAAHLLDAAGQELPEAIREQAELRQLALRFKQQYIRKGQDVRWKSPSCGSCACSYPLDTHLWGTGDYR
jgi:hypothetical protein